MKDSPHPHSPLEFGLTKINSDLYPQKKKEEKNKSQQERRIRKGVNIDYPNLEKKNQELVNRCPRNYLFLCLFISHTSLKVLQLLTEGMFYSKQNINKFNFSSFVVENKLWNIKKEVYTKLYF